MVSIVVKQGFMLVVVMLVKYMVRVATTVRTKTRTIMRVKMG